VYNGFKRPHAENTDIDPRLTSIYPYGHQPASPRLYNPYCCPYDSPFKGCTGPPTKRESWYFGHRVRAFVVIVMALFQLDTGLNLYANEYTPDDSTALIILWGWIGFLLVFFAGVKCYVKSTEKPSWTSKHPDNLMPQRDEDEEEMEHIMVVPTFAPIAFERAMTM
jgi:hypothetical protein